MDCVGEARDRILPEQRESQLCSGVVSGQVAQTIHQLRRHQSTGR